MNAESDVKLLWPWVIFVVVSSGAGGLMTVGAGVIIGLLAGQGGADVRQISIAVEGVAFALGIAVSYVAFDWVVRRFVLPQLRR